MSESGNHNDASEFEMFFNAADRLYLESCTTAALQGGKSVLIASKSKEMLDYYGPTLIKRLNKALPETSVEVFKSTDASSLLHQFNKRLVTLKLDVSTQHRDGLLPEKIWVIHDANALTTHDLNLFSRLLLKFPGAGVCAILMFSTVNEHIIQLSQQNEQFVSWILELPTPEQKIAAIEQSKMNGNEEFVLAFFKNITESRNREEARASGAIASDGSVEKKSIPESLLKAPQIGQYGKSWGLALVFFLAILLGLTVWFFPAWYKNISFFSDFFEPESTTHKLATFSPELVKEKPTERAETEDRALSNSVAETKVESALLPKIEKVMAPLPAIAVQGQMWLKALPDNIFLLEHGAYETVKQAQAAINGKAWLAKARIVPSYIDDPDTPKFVVVTGPFRSIDRANNTIIRLDLTSEVAIKSQVSLLKQSTP